MIEESYKALIDLMASLTDDVKAELEKYRSMTPHERLQEEVDYFNATTHGTLNEQDGWDCPTCHNSGYIARIGINKHGEEEMQHVKCKCMKVRKSIRALKASGLEDEVKRCRFDNYETTEPWQARLKETAQAFTKAALEDSSEAHCLFFGGQSGAGKSHLCTAVFREFLLANRLARYAQWVGTAQGIKAVANDAEAYKAAIDELAECDLLYIDDLFKPVNNAAPTAADVRLAYDIINRRYVRHKPTIVSSELLSDEIIDIDEATGGRIVEMAAGYTINIKRDRTRNYRLRSTMEV